MSGLQRREFLAGFGVSAAAASAALAASRKAVGGDVSFMNNVPDPVTSEEELPTFKFELEKSRGKVIGESYGKEATVKQLPISKGIAGVSMKLEPGAMRELHWHATAAEWAFVLEGRCRTTVIDGDGAAEANDFGPGDVWYFPRGHGHMIECLGDEPTHFILVFDNGYFSEFGTFSITDWLGGVPRELVAKNLGLPVSTFEGIPKKEVYFARGARTYGGQTRPLQGWKEPALTHKYELMKRPPRRSHLGGLEWRVSAEEFPISTTTTGVVLHIEPGGLRELHWHPTADEWLYYIKGHARMSLFGSNGRHRFEEFHQGDVGYVPQGFGHSIENLGDDQLEVLVMFNSGRFVSIDLSTWIAGNPTDVLAKNFGLPAATFEKFPREDVFIAPDNPDKGG